MTDQLLRTLIIQRRFNTQSFKAEKTATYCSHTENISNLGGGFFPTAMVEGVLGTHVNQKENKILYTVSYFTDCIPNLHLFCLLKDVCNSNKL